MRIPRGTVALILLTTLAACSSSSPAAKPVAKPAAPSPLHPTAAPTAAFPVSERNLTVNCAGGSMMVNLWYPAAAVGNGTPFANGEFPAVLFSHGLDLIPGNYYLLLKAWAAAGITVIAPVYPHTSEGSTSRDPNDVNNQPAEGSCALTKALADPVLRAHVDASRIAAAGHSDGGLTTVGLFSGAARDPRLIAGVVLAGGTLGSATYAGTPAPILFVHGTKDPTVVYSYGQKAYQEDPWPKGFLSLTGETHLDPYTNSADSALATVITATTDFLRWTLYGDATAKTRLAADAKPAGTLAQAWN